MDRIRGTTIRWTLADGPLEGETFDHTFADDGTVSWMMLDGDGPSPEVRYESAQINEDVGVVSYLGMHGYTLTVVLDFRTGKLVGFASNEKELVMHHGTFEVLRPLQEATPVH